ncbi:hypothetical protein PSTT_05983 [Puccinia striiformis]|uniref:Uncharacterized protein n=1 Tax=Puccinia striiformis TaxID=27350 RepID=A0A2S4VLZ3_9BASI|nr:hypothetical protein PSTT_05983 [Puccinia striiformis]
MKTTTTSGRQLIVTQTGIRYSKLNRLGYCDPVKHVSLGMMHNWMEGVLMHHFREHWGFQTLSTKEKRRRGGDQGPSAKRPRLDLTQAETQLDEEEPSDTDDDEDFELNQGASGGSALADVILPTSVNAKNTAIAKVFAITDNRIQGNKADIVKYCYQSGETT